MVATSVGQLKTLVSSVEITKRIFKKNNKMNFNPFFVLTFALLLVVIGDVAGTLIHTQYS